MANKFRGEIEFALTPEHTLHLKTTFDAIARLENGLSKGVSKIIAECVDPEQLRVSTLAGLLFWLQDPTKSPKTLEDIGNIIVNDVKVEHLASLVLKASAEVVLALLGRTPEEIADIEKKAQALT